MFNLIYTYVVYVVFNFKIFYQMVYMHSNKNTKLMLKLRNKIVSKVDGKTYEMHKRRHIKYFIGRIKW